MFSFFKLKQTLQAWADWATADPVDRRYWRLRNRLVDAQAAMDEFDAWCAGTGTEVRAIDPRLLARAINPNVKPLW